MAMAACGRRLESVDSAQSVVHAGSQLRGIVRPLPLGVSALTCTRTRAPACTHTLHCCSRALTRALRPSVCHVVDERAWPQLRCGMGRYVGPSAPGVPCVQPSGAPMIVLGDVFFRKSSLLRSPSLSPLLARSLRLLLCTLLPAPLAIPSTPPSLPTPSRPFHLSCGG